MVDADDAAPHSEADVWAAVDRRREAIVALLADLDPKEWDAPSLCEAWTVRQVAAHLTMPLLSRPALVAMALRHPGSTNRLIRDSAIELARRHDTETLVEQIVQMVGHHRPFPGLTCREALIDAVGHTFDITLPLGREVDVPPADIAAAADRVVAYAGRGKAKVFRSLPVWELRLAATDHPWVTGAGPVVTGRMADLFLALTGRTARLDALTGPGAERLRAAVA